MNYHHATALAGEALDQEIDVALAPTSCCASVVEHDDLRVGVQELGQCQSSAGFPPESDAARSSRSPVRMPNSSTFSRNAARSGLRVEQRMRVTF